jgi:aspartyl-tRNA(Asn)/glutamyl-tRNA(Gln) amidotransferase subunit A
MADSPVFRSVRELSALIRAGTVSPVDLTHAFLDRLETLGPRYNAVVTVTRDLALAQAAQAEREIASGQYRGPLHGIPYGAKDLLATAGGIPTTWGAAPFRQRCFDRDATVIRRLREAGAVLAAKLAMVELAGGMGYRQPDASFTGPGVNPWDPTRWSGGSSSGSGSAVAAGLVPFAIGSETWGSILGPANHCGVAGLRPTLGRVSRFGAMVLSWTLDKIGSLCLTPDDCGLVLEAISGPDPADPSTTDRPFEYAPASLGRRLRLGVIDGVADGADVPTRANFETALQTLERIADIESVRLPALPYEEVTRTILFGEMASAFEDLIEHGHIAGLTAPEDRYTPYSRVAVLAKDYIRALRIRGVVAAEVERAMRGYDAWVGPSRPVSSTKLDEEFPSAIRGASTDLMGAIGNAAGLPAISVPNGFTETGVPTGLQFLGRAFDETGIIAAASAYQALTDWHLRRPPGISSEGMEPAGPGV